MIMNITYNIRESIMYIKIIRYIKYFTLTLLGTTTGAGIIFQTNSLKSDDNANYLYALANSPVAKLYLYIILI